MSVVNKEIKFSSKIQTDDSFNVFKKYHDLLITEMFYFQQQWLTAAFRRFKDFDKYIILIYLINKAFKGYNDHFVVNSFDEFYSKDKFEIPKINIIDLSRELNISKETTRRKMMELEKEGAIKKNKKKVMLERRGQEIQKPTDSIRNLSRVISHFTDYLTRENILKGKIAKNEIEEKKSEIKIEPVDVSIKQTKKIRKKISKKSSTKESTSKELVSIDKSSVSRENNIIKKIFLIIISIIAFILLIDTFKNQISVIFPGILKMSDSLYLVINDLKLFIKDLVR